MKILFLDHDGVICLAKQWGSRNSKRSKKKNEFFDNFCPKAISVLNKIIEETDCEIVVSSDWRNYKDLEYMQKLYLNRGILKQPIGYTPVFSDRDHDIYEETKSYKDFYQISARVREKEIRYFIQDNPEITSWVAVDDLPMHKLKSFVHTPRAHEGIKQIGIKEKIIKSLNRGINNEK